MDIQTILAFVFLGFTIICLMVLLFLCVLLTYKSEKEFRELRNEELKARISFFNHYINK